MTATLQRPIELGYVNGDVVELDSALLVVLEELKVWAFQRIPDHMGEALPNWLRIGYEQRVPPEFSRVEGAVEEYIGAINTLIGDSGSDFNAEVDGGGTEKRLQTTRAAFALQALCRYALLRPQALPEMRDELERGARRLAGFQYRDTRKLIHGGFRGGASDGTASTHGTAACGMAMLLAYQVLERPVYLNSAIDAAGFVARLTVPASGSGGPNNAWLDKYGVAPCPTAQPGHVCDKVSTNTVADKAYITGSTWSIYCAVFLQELSSYLGTGSGQGGETFLPLVALIRDYFAPLVIDGYSFFAPASVSGTYVETAWSVNTDLDPNDDDRHRSGEINGKTTFGNDGICYGIDALWRTGYDIDETKAAYETYALAVHGGGVDWGEGVEANQFGFAAGYDGRIGWPSYFRGEPGGTGVHTLRGYAASYDIWKTGWLLPFKAAHYPTDYQLSLELAYRTPHLGTLAKADFDSYFSFVTGKYIWKFVGNRPRMQTMFGLIDSIGRG